MSSVATIACGANAGGVEEGLLTVDDFLTSSPPPSPRIRIIPLPFSEDLEDASYTQSPTPPLVDNILGLQRTPLGPLAQMADVAGIDFSDFIEALQQSPGGTIVVIEELEDDGTLPLLPLHLDQLQDGDPMFFAPRRARYRLDNFIACGGVFQIIQLMIMPTISLAIASFLIPRTSSTTLVLFAHASTYSFLLSAIFQILAICFDALSTAFADPPEPLDPDLPITWRESISVSSVVAAAAGISLFMVATGLLAVEYTSYGPGSLACDLGPALLSHRRGRLRYGAWLLLALRR